MSKVYEIREPISKEMEIFENKFSKLMLSDVPLLNRITHYIIKRKGKQMRPMLIFLCSKLLSSGNVNEKVYRGASVIELIHTATLIHDDVVDESNKRRGFFSINAIWKNKIAVLVGDFLLSKGMLLCIDNKDYDILDVISESVKQMSEGELLQIEKAKKLDIDEETYFEIIKKKTASLISSCCKIAAVSVNSSSSEVKRITKIGKRLRKYKIDEIPELINVLVGDMSFVGPRPDVPGYADLLEGNERNILKLRPGITSLASIKYSNEEQLLLGHKDPIAYNKYVIFPDKVKMNLNYYENNNIWIDIKIIFATLFALFE